VLELFVRLACRKESKVIEVIKGDKRHFSDFGWLKTYWLFSFSSYFDPHNIQFGALRVFNDDIVEPGTGFPTHPHEEMEIVTIVLKGEMTHQDSMGNKAVIKAGDVQRMSARTGLTHSEFNLSDKPVHFYQIWIYPDHAGLIPSHDQKSYHSHDWKNRLYPVASDQDTTGSVTFHKDATIYRCCLEAKKNVMHNETAERRVFLYLTDGQVSANGMALKAKDQARIDIEEPLVIQAQQPSELILIDVPSCKGWGYNEATLKGKRI
jgi:redox-sensitive bicupin YhaK (pirin superfamily)